jgi:light-regulated signal transduction histidine kinase (bacteriophytochrome)
LATAILFWCYTRRNKKRIKETLDRLENVKSTSDELFHITAHDLQEPLRKVQAFGDRIKSANWETLDEKSQDYLIYIINAAGRMQVLIEELQKYSKVANKNVEVVAIDLNEMVSRILHEYKDQLEPLNASIKIEELPVIQGDVWEVRQVFRLLLENAIKFRNPKRNLEIKIYSKLRNNQNDLCIDKDHTIYIEDNGIGFDDKYTNRIFQIFQRLHLREMYEGTGMGLAICRKIMEQHMGTITAHGMPDHGATFVFTFPDSKK